MGSTDINNEVIALINQLCRKANLDLPDYPLKISSLTNRQMSFRISPRNNNLSSTRNIGKVISEIMWGTNEKNRTLAMLYTDLNGELYELDVWKTNFSTPTELSGWKNEILVKAA